MLSGRQNYLYAAEIPEKTRSNRVCFCVMYNRNLTPWKTKLRSVGDSCSITDTSVLYSAGYKNASEMESIIWKKSGTRKEKLSVSSCGLCLEFIRAVPKRRYRSNIIVRCYPKRKPKLRSVGNSLNYRHFGTITCGL